MSRELLYLSAKNALMACDTRSIRARLPGPLVWADYPVRGAGPAMPNGLVPSVLTAPSER
jgi:hypothetical protein